MKSADASPRRFRPDASLFDIMEESERRIILDTLEKCDWNQTEAAARFRIPLSTLNQKIKRLHIDVDVGQPLRVAIVPQDARDRFVVEGGVSRQVWYVVILERCLDGALSGTQIRNGTRP